VLTPQLHFTGVCFLLSASYHLINQSIFFQQETRAGSIEKDLKLPKGAGRISEALESTLQGTNVQQQQSYHSNSLIGNHINICLQVLY